MFQSGASRRLRHLWQLPLLFVSLGLFAVAAYLYVDGRPTITITQKLSQAKKLLADGRPDAAVESINRLVTSEKFERDAEAQIHLALAEALDAAQKQRKDKVAANFRRIIEETQIALGQGVRPTGDIHSRLGESYEALDQPVEAVGQYRQAIALDPNRALRLQRKVIDLQIAQSDWAPAEASIDAYLASKEITDAERAWAKSVKAQVLIDRGEFVDARRLLDESLRLDNDAIAQAEARYRLGVCAWKLGNASDGEKMLKAARSAFKGQHPLDADAAYALGRIAQERNDPAGAIELFDVVLKNDPQSSVAPLAKLSRGMCRIQQRDDAAGVEDLSAVTDQAKTIAAIREQTMLALQRACEVVTARQNYQAAVELLTCEQSLEKNPPASFYQRLAVACEKRAEQIEQSAADATDAEKVRRKQLAREMCVRAADANLVHCRALSVAGEKGYDDALWKAADLYARGESTNGAIAALEVFLTERADDAMAPDVALRLGKTCESVGQDDKAIGAYRRLVGAYPKSPAAKKAALPLAMLLSKSPDSLASARNTLARAVDDPQAVKDSDEYRTMLFELGRLGCRSGDFKDAAARLEQFVARFTSDERAMEATFLLAECDRELAQQTDAQVATATVSAEDKPSAGDLNHAEAAKKQQLAQAAELYKRCSELVSTTKPTPEAEVRYQKLSALRFADCQFEMKAYDEALGQYQLIADRWPDDPVALAALVQVVNVSCAMKKLDEARAVNERVRKQLAVMPKAAFAETGAATGGTILPRAHWEQWLKWTGTNSGLSW